MNSPRERAWAKQPVRTPHYRLLAPRPVGEQSDHLGGDRILNWPHDERVQRNGWERACSLVGHQERPVAEIVTAGRVKTEKKLIQIQRQIGLDVAQCDAASEDG